MTNFQKTVSVFLSLCFLAVLAGAPELNFLWENVYRQLPLYCFAEKEAEKLSWSEDSETSERIIGENAAYLAQGESGKEDDGEPEPGEEEQDGAEEENRKREVKQEPGEEEQGVSEGEEEEQDGAEEESRKREGKPEPGEEEPGVSEGEEEEQGGAEEESRKREGKPEPGEEEQGVSEDGEQDDAGREGQEAEQDITEAEKKKGQSEKENGKEEEEPLEAHPEIDLSPEKLADYEYLLSQFYIVDPATSASPELIDGEKFLASDMTLKQDASAPQILIYHSHSQEAFADSREGKPEDTIVGVGDYLTELLTEQYGYQVIHVTETFDVIDGETDRSRAYDYAREYVEKLLEETPSIEVIIDLHRDGMPDDRRLVTEIGGKPTAQVMFFNGISYTNNNGAVEYLPNPYIQDNLAFSFQLQYQAARYYPDFYRGIYLAGLRYNLHLRPKALLLEAGAQTNTLQEVKNAMEPFAEILHMVLSP